jgi:transcriptional regulator with XRE-family HTH domain
MERKIQKSMEISRSRFDIGSRIKALRRSCGSNGLSQAELAHHVGTTPNTVSRWETGIYMPSVDDIVRLASFFNVPLLAFFPTLDPSPHVTKLIVATRDLPDTELDDVIQYVNFKRTNCLKKRG